MALLLRRRPITLASLSLSARDQRVLALACRKLGPAPTGFAEVLRALHEAVAESTPAGRCYILGASAHGPVIGSLVSQVGGCDSPGGALLVSVQMDGALAVVGSLVSLPPGDYP